MDQEQPPQSPQTGPLTPAAAGAPPAHGQVVHVVARPGGFSWAIWCVVGLLCFAAMFGIGLAVGAATIFAGTMLDTTVIEEPYRDGDRHTIAIISVEGFIDGLQAETVRALVDHALRERRTKAVVLRVDSPGGGIAASDEIWYQINRIKNAGLPVVASYGGLAASGGYYISCATDHIFAEPTCITGSIGVIAQTFILKDLMDKVGIEPVTLLSTDSPQKDLGNPFREWSEADRQKYVSLLDSAYEIFISRVQDGRKKTLREPGQVEMLADGSIYTAQEALKNGLVDAIGYLDDAVTHAERLAGLSPGRSKVVILREPPSLFGNAPFSIRSRGAPAQGLDADRIRTLVNELSLPRVMYLMR